MVSIALCTYNGERYVREQLDSILNQTLLPDEIVICDDCSSDSTESILKEYQTRYSSISICLYENEYNLGYRKNFSKAIELCHGDYIFLSDQDDIWASEKIETIVNWFNRHPRKQVVFTDGVFINENTDSIYENLSLFKCVGMNKLARFWMKCGYGMELFLKNNRATGATMAFRSDFRTHFHIEIDGPVHDEMICLAAIDEGCLGFIPRPLIEYRIHPSQSCGLGDLINCPKKTDNIIHPLNDNINKGKYLTNNKLVCRYCLIKDRSVWVTSPNGLSHIVANISRYFHAYPLLFGLCVLFDTYLFWFFNKSKNNHNNKL